MTAWTLGEKQLIAAAGALAASVHNTQPWVLEFHDDHEVVTQPFQVPEVLAGLVEALSLNGFPQLLLRLGHP